MPAQSRFEYSTAMNLTNAKPGMSMRLAKCQRKFRYGVGELLPEVEGSAFELTLDAP